MRVDAVILAAGNSSRLGQPKQLLVLDGETLLRRTIRVAQEATGTPVTVVLGAHADRLREELVGIDVLPVYCKNWEEGMGGSLAAGATALPSNTEAAMIMLCDQPLVEAEHLRLMITQAEKSNALIVAAAYGSTLGAPALFRRPLFTDLQTIPGDKGARYLIQRHRQETVAFALPEATHDIDTVEDFDRLRLGGSRVSR